MKKFNLIPGYNALRRVYLFIGLLLLSGLVFSLNDPKKGYKIGDIAADFQLTSTEYETVSLKDFTSSKGYIIVFTSISCPYAKMYEDRIIQLHHNYRSIGYPVIAINSNDSSIEAEDSFDEMKKRATEKQYPFPYLHDEVQEVCLEYGAKRTPQVYLLDRNKRIQYIGAIDDNARDEKAVLIKYVENAIAALEDGKAPDISFAQAVGCGIKSKLDRKRKSLRMSEKW